MDPHLTGLPRPNTGDFGLIIPSGGRPTLYFLIPVCRSFVLNTVRLVTMNHAKGKRNPRWQLACLALAFTCAALRTVPVFAGGKVPVDPEYQPEPRVPIGSVPTIDLNAGVLQPGRLLVPAAGAVTTARLSMQLKLSGMRQPDLNPVLPNVIVARPEYTLEAMPVLPVISERARQIYARGLARGMNPRAFSKIGDCMSVHPYFLAPFDVGLQRYNLGPYSKLQATIDFYDGSFGRKSLAVSTGFTITAVFSPMWSDASICGAEESPLGCEVRVHRPSIALLLLGTNDAQNGAFFGASMQRAIDFLVTRGILPILATKADNLEGDDHINRIIIGLARDNQLPLWNFWRATRALPGYGLVKDGFHLTFAKNRFNDPEAMRAGWVVRNLTALQTIDAVRRGLDAP